MDEKDNRLSFDISEIPSDMHKALSDESLEGQQPLLPGVENGMFPEFSNRHLKTRSKRRMAILKNMLLTIAVGIIAGLASGLAAFYTAKIGLQSRGHYVSSPVPVSMNEDEWLSCGETPAEARSLGCVFDVMLSSWVHSECHDQEYMESFLSKVTFPWYRNRNMTDPVDEAEVRLGEYDTLYMYQDFHYEHCMYMWRIQMIKWKKGLPIDSGSWDIDHSEHCAQVMLDPKLEYPKNFTKNRLGFFSCGRPYTLEH